MDSGICILLMILLILGFALLLAWLSAKSSDTDALRLCITLPPEDAAGAPQQLCVESLHGCVEVHLSPAPPSCPHEACETDANRFNFPARADDADF